MQPRFGAVSGWIGAIEYQGRERIDPGIVKEDSELPLSSVEVVFLVSKRSAEPQSGSADAVGPVRHSVGRHKLRLARRSVQQLDSRSPMPRRYETSVNVKALERDILSLSHVYDNGHFMNKRGGNAMKSKPGSTSSILPPSQRRGGVRARISSTPKLSLGLLLGYILFIRCFLRLLQQCYGAARGLPWQCSTTGSPIKCERRWSIPPHHHTVRLRRQPSVILYMIFSSL